MKQQSKTVFIDFIKIYLPVMAVILTVSVVLYYFDNQPQRKWIAYVISDICSLLLIGFVAWFNALINTKRAYVENDLKQEKEKRRQAQLALKNSATHDDLTGLPNRTLLYDRLTLLIAQAARGNQIFGVLFIDLDEFKEINDSLGHEVGDLVLQKTAQKILSVLRKSDTVARIGGDEFIVVLPDVTEITTVSTIAQKLMDIINLPILINFKGREVEKSVGTSIGISIYPADGQTIDTLINSAERSMYEAKRAGKNHFCRVSQIVS